MGCGRRDKPVPAGAVVWLTGLPCAGKSTIASLTEIEIRRRGRDVVVLDGDELRRTVSADLSFSTTDRYDHARRVAELAATALAAGALPIVALVSPYRRARSVAREILGDAFLEVFVDAPASVCEDRDLKGMYARARRGVLAGFTGVSAPYEPPESPELRLRTSEERPSQSVARVIALLESRGALSPLGGSPSTRDRAAKLGVDVH